MHDKISDLEALYALDDYFVIDPSNPNLPDLLRKSLRTCPLGDYNRPITLIIFTTTELDNPISEPIGMYFKNGNRRYYWRDKHWAEYDISHISRSLKSLYLISSDYQAILNNQYNIGNHNECSSFKTESPETVLNSQIDSSLSSQQLGTFYKRYESISKTAYVPDGYYLRSKFKCFARALLQVPSDW
jgi:hypothetical protein